jgi:signal transduction histidine kinase
MSPSAAVLSTQAATDPAPQPFATLVGNPPPGRQVSKGESALLATVAHELRNPLASLRLSLDLLVADFDELPAERKLLLIERARRSVAFLGGLVENLTCGSAVQAGQLQVKPSTVELNACIDEAVGLVQSLLAQRGQTTRVFCASETTLVTGDRPRVIQVLANLLSNASRYSVENDTIEVHVTATAHHVRVRVSDHGPGISPEDQQRVFSAWVRGERAAPGGLGLGLSIVQNLVQQLGGRVGVESALGQGATFWFTLPVAA